MTDFANRFISNHGSLGGTIAPGSMTAPQVAQLRAVSPATPQTGMSAAQTSNAISAIGSVALSAIAAHHSHAMDRIRYKMEQSQAEFTRATQFQARQQQAWLSARNRDKLKESLATERLAFEIDSMKASAQIENRAAAAGISNVDSVVQDFQKSALRQEMYQRSEHLAKLEASRIEGIDTQRRREVVYDPAPAMSGQSAFTQFGIDTLQIGKAAFGPVQKG